MERHGLKEIGGFVQHFTPAQITDINALLQTTLDKHIGYC